VRSERPVDSYWRLLSRYLGPRRGRMALLGAILGGAIAVQVAAPLLIGRFIDRAIGGDAGRGLVWLALATVGLALVGQLIGVVETFVAEEVSWTATNQLRTDLVAHLLRLDAGFHTAHTPGELIERVDGDVATLARFFSRFTVYVVGNILLMIVILALLFGVSWQIGAAVCGFVLVAAVVMWRIRAAAVPLWAAERQATAEYYGTLGDYLAGLEDVRASGASAYVQRRCADAMRSWRAITHLAQMRGYAMVAAGDGLFGLGSAAALALGAMQFRSGSLTIGTLYLIFRYTTMLREPAEQIRNEIQDLQRADASIGRIEALLSTTSRIVDRGEVELPAGPMGIEFDGVSFGYIDGAEVLRDVSFYLPPGQVLGVIGPTGSGKTTLTRLISRFYDPDTGAVRLGGVESREARLPDVRSRIGILSQEVQLLNGTLRDNLTLYNDRLTDDELTGVLEEVGLAGWLRTLPLGLETRLGPGGTGVSAGEAQLIACARILLRDPDLVILDEPSSRLDPVSERSLQVALTRLIKGKTTIVIAHRLATLAAVDQILVLEEGKVREFGSRRQLAGNARSRYAELLRLGDAGMPL
jgi:ATP-binding cassette, subfamily B, bacterial